MVFNILANLTVPLVGLADTAMLGHLDDIRFLGGVALATILFDYIYWSLGFLRGATTGTTAQAVGAGREREVYRVLYRSLVLAAAIAALLLAAHVGIRELGFWLLSGETVVEAAGRDYFNARIWAAPATLANLAFLGWFLGREQSGRVLGLTAFANLTNVALNYVFILRLGWAARGAGVATAVSQWLMLALALILFLGQRERRPSWRWSRILERRRMSKLLALNGDIFVRSLALATTFAVFTNFSSVFGTQILAANAILMRLFLFASFMVDGVAYAAESLAGVLRGARDLPALLRLERVSLAWGGAFVTAFLVVMTLLSGQVWALLTSHTTVRELAASYVTWLWPVLIFGYVAFVYDGLYMGLTDGRALRNSTLVAAAVFLPLAFLARENVLPHLLWGAMVAFMAIRALTLGIAARRRFPHLLADSVS